MLLTKTQRLLQRAAKLAKKQGLSSVPFSWSDLGDVYHVYGVNARAEHLVALLARRQARLRVSS